MTAKDPATAAAEAAAKELVKVAYGDLLQPAAQEVGLELQQFVRTIMIAGRGFGALIRETYEPFVLRAIRQISHERRVLPNPPLLGQILEGISYEQQGSSIYEMFQNLLSSSMNSDKVNLVHPSFPGIVKILAADEARILFYLTHTSIERMLIPRTGADGQPDNIMRFIVDDVGLHFPENADFYMDRLFIHGLMDWDQKRQRPFEFEGQPGACLPLKLSKTGARLMAACTHDVDLSE